MPSVPRIARADPGPPSAYRHIDPTPVIARLHWLSPEHLEDARAWAIATSPTRDRAHAATLVCWLHDGEPRNDWIPTFNVRRPGAEHSGRRLLAFRPPPLLSPDVRPGPPRP